MSKHSGLAASLSRRARESARRRRNRDLKVESLEPRLALATGLLSTLVQVHDQSGQNLLAPGATADIHEGQEVAASVSLKRKPNSDILVTFKSAAAALEAGVAPTTLLFTRDNWKVPQTVPLRSLQDNVLDNNQRVSVQMTTAVAKSPQSQAATKKIWIESIDSQILAPASPVTATYRGSAFGGGTKGAVVGNYDSVLKRGTAALTLTLPGVKNFINRKISFDYSLNLDNTVRVDQLNGIPASKVRFDLTHRVVGLEQGLFGTVTVFDPRLGQSATATISANAGVGIVTNGTTFTGGGFDGQGNAYSWEALGSSSTLPWNGVTFDLASPNQPNFIWANGQTIAVPQGQENVNVLNLAGAAVNGSQQNQKLTLTFTDGSTAVWTQSFSDWSSPQNYDQESIVQTQTYVNSASGVTSQRYNYVYGYSYAIPYGKALASVTLPDTANVRILDLQMSSSTAIFLEYNAFGIAAPGKNLPNSKGFNNKGQYYNSQLLGNEIAWAGATFPIGAVTGTSNNFVLAQGQVVSLPLGSYEWLYLAGAVNTGRADSHSQQFTLTFSDGSTAVWSQSMSWWYAPSNSNGGVFNGETIILMGDTVVNQVGGTPKDTNYVYGYAYQIPAGKTLVSITLPNNNYLGILGMAMV
jgi:hypothetical protein